MKIHLWAVLLVAIFRWSGVAAEADAKQEVARVVERFYQQYGQAKDGAAWIGRSKQVTPEFKAAYAKLMKREYVDADPILQAQEDLPSPVKANKVVIRGETAEATIGLTEPGEWRDWKVKVRLVQRGEMWLINGIGDLQGK